MNRGTIVAHDNAVLRQRLSSSEVLNAKERRSAKRNTSVCVRETLEQSYWHSSFPLPIDMLTTTSQPFMNLLTAVVHICVSESPVHCHRLGHYLLNVLIPRPHEILPLHETRHYFLLRMCTSWTLPRDSATVSQIE